MDSFFLIHVGFNVIIIALVAGFGVYGLRSFLILIKYKELKDIKRLWLPVIASGFFVFAWSLEDLMVDLGVLNMGIGMVIINLTLLAAVLLFSLGIVRFSRIWIEYARKRDEALREKHAF